MNFRCPICKKRIDSTGHKDSDRMKFFPFCSERCKLIDLGAWLNNDYVINAPLNTHQNPEEPHK
ncbi:MAG: DNA gyrase inhibitor YacG [Sedimentisphaerales bacterium]|nr:DNA gyrase inhibitor YacG [Sedimentisphaerales bacterium]